MLHGSLGLYSGSLGLYCWFIGVILPVHWGYIPVHWGYIFVTKIVASQSLHHWRTQTARTNSGLRLDATAGVNDLVWPFFISFHIHGKERL